MNNQQTSIYTMETRVRYSACTSSRQARLSDIFEYLQDACTFQAEDLGVGLDYMQEHQTAWVLNSWQADIDRYPVFGEKIRISTWPYDFNGFLGYRNFKIEDDAGNILVRANSVWVFMDMRKNRPSRIAPEVAAAYQTQPRLEMEYMDRRLPELESGTAKDAFQIPRYFIDTNRHVNNVKYILFAEELFPQELQPARVRAEYKRPAVYGGVFYPYIQQKPDCWSVKLNGEDGKPYAAMEFYAKIPS